MKKFLVFILTLSLVTSLLAPFAIGATGFPDSAPVDGAGQALSFETGGDILSGILPTNANLNFVIDPQGIFGLATDGSVSVDDLEPNPDVIFTSGTDGGVLSAFNTGSVDALLSVQVSASADNATLVATAEALTDVGADEGRNLLLWAQPSAVLVTNTEGDVAATVLEEFEGYGKVLPVTDGNTTAEFLLPAVAHTRVLDGVPTNGVFPTTVQRTEDENGPVGPDHIGTSISFGGVINLGTAEDPVDWSEAENLAISAIFTLTPATPEQSVAEQVDGAFGLIATDGNVLIAPPVVDVPGATPTPSPTPTPPPQTLGFIAGDLAGYTRISPTEATINMSAAPGFFTLPFMGLEGATVTIEYVRTAWNMPAASNWRVETDGIMIFTARATIMRGQPADTEYRIDVTIDGTTVSHTLRLV